MSDILRSDFSGAVNIQTGSARRSDGGGQTIWGYGAVFYSPKIPGTELTLGPGIRERIHPRAFDKTLRENKRIISTFNHDPNHLLGTTQAGTLRLSVDSIGLRYSIDLPSNYIGEAVAESVRRGDLNGASIWFRIKQDKKIFPPNGDVVWEVLEIDLIEIGPVAMPAYRATSAHIKVPAKTPAVAMSARDRAKQKRRDLDLVLCGLN